MGNVNMTTKLAATAVTASVIFGWGVLKAPSAQGVSFEFSYTDTTGEILSGIVDGELAGDGNRVSNLTNLEGSHSGLANVVFNQLDRVDFFTLDGSFVSLSLSETTQSNFIFLNNNLSSGGTASGYSTGGTILFNQAFDSNAWQASLKDDRTPASIPESGNFATLIFLGSLAVGGYLKSHRC